MLAQICQPKCFFSKTVERAAVGSGTMLRSSWLMDKAMKTSDQLLSPMFSAVNIPCMWIIGRLNCARSLAAEGNDPLPVATETERTVRAASHPIVLFVVV